MDFDTFQAMRSSGEAELLGFATGAASFTIPFWIIDCFRCNTGFMGEVGRLGSIELYDGAGGTLEARSTGSKCRAAKEEASGT